MTNLGLASVHFIPKKILKVTKISARWTPNLLTDEQCEGVNGRTTAREVPKIPEKKVFDRLITCDKT